MGPNIWLLLSLPLSSLDFFSSVTDSGISGTAHLITLFRDNSQANMASQLMRAVIVLILMAPVDVVAHLHPRQMTLNQTTTPTGNTSQATSIATPPPCCWIVVGEVAVGYNSWYSSIVEKTVGTYSMFTRFVQRADRDLKPLS
jgi:hypothetical protein